MERTFTTRMMGKLGLTRSRGSQAAAGTGAGARQRAHAAKVRAGQVG